MYWPYGVPRIYSLHKAGKTPFISDSGTEDDEDNQNLSHDDAPSTDSVETPTASSNYPDNPEGHHAVDSLDEILGLQVSKPGHLFATITKQTLAIWQTRPTAVLAAVTRSSSSLGTYGPNVAVLLRPDSAVVAVHTLNGYLLTYSIVVDPVARVYQQQFESSQTRRHGLARYFESDDMSGLREVSLRSRTPIKIDAGISKALALDRELVVATRKPAAIQCIKWVPDNNGPQTSTELLSKMPWFSKKSTVKEMFHDRAMSLSIWVTDDGRCYAVQRIKDDITDPESPKKLFQGYCFHEPQNTGEKVLQAAVNARFSLIAVSCAKGEIWIYSVKDYSGNISVSHKLQSPGSVATTGDVTFLSYSPDGYCLFAGYERGWTTWSVFGKPGATSFNSNCTIADANKETWLHGVSTGSWLSGGSEILLTAPGDGRLWNLEMARSAVTGCFSSSNLARALLQTTTEIVVYQGHDLPDLTTISGEASLWHHAQFPSSYLHTQWPIRSCVISQDGRYVAVAGRRGLAHYSLHSGRWKVFEDADLENAFSVRGGMCWYGHILIAAIESDDSFELRLYSRELNLDNASILHVESLPAPVVLVGPSGEDSLLVYTYENILYHYVINVMPGGVSLVQVGQIALHGIVRAPTRVRSVSWVIPDNQLRNGDPSQDVSVASVLFLVDDKLVLLQPSRTDDGSLKYEMRVVAQHIEYYILMRDQLSFNFAPPVDESTPPSPSAEVALNGSSAHHSLRDSLWVFGGSDLRMWNDVQDVLRISSEGMPLETGSSLTVPIDFYPLSILLNKGVVLGVESEMIQRRDVTFAIFRIAIRTHLFIPYLLRHQLFHLDTPAALALAHHYTNLSYFPHALEMLLHNVLDDEVDSVSSKEAHASADDGGGQQSSGARLLPAVLMFIQSSFPTDMYLDIIVQCTRKTELRSWRILFAHLPPPKELFEQALSLGLLKTAGGYLLVMQAFDDEEGGEQRTVAYVVRLLRLAKEKDEWELCGELARFLVALDVSGEALRHAVADAGFHAGESSGDKNGRKSLTPSSSFGLGLNIPQPSSSKRSHLRRGPPGARSPSRSPRSADSDGDYFSSSPGEH